MSPAIWLITKAPIATDTKEISLGKTWVTNTPPTKPPKELITFPQIGQMGSGSGGHGGIGMGHLIGQGVPHHPTKSDNTA